MVVNWGGVTVVTTGSAGGPGSGSGSGGTSGSTLRVRACLAASHQAGLERWTRSSASGTGSRAACKRHGC